jgi:NarL family two-component system response regulator LiaR
MVREAMGFLLQPFEDIECVGSASDGEEALRLCDSLDPDVVLLDMVMPGMDGPTVTRAIRQRHPNTEVLALTAFYDADLVRRVLEAGAIGYELKGASMSELARAIRSAHQGQSTLAREAMQALVNGADSGPGAGNDLTERERQVLLLMTEGLSNAEIAERLVISLSTVKAHTSHIYEKLGVSSRSQAVSLALKLNLVTSDSG